MPTITVNGVPRRVRENTSISALLAELSLQPEATVVERNRDILDRARYAEVILEEGDALELVRFVGGG